MGDKQIECKYKVRHRAPPRTIISLVCLFLLPYMEIVRNARAARREWKPETELSVEHWPGVHKPNLATAHWQRKWNYRENEGGMEAQWILTRKLSLIPESTECFSMKKVVCSTHITWEALGSNKKWQSRTHQCLWFNRKISHMWLDGQLSIEEHIFFL